MTGEDEPNQTVDTALEEQPETAPQEPAKPAAARRGLTLSPAFWASGGVVVGLVLALGFVFLTGRLWPASRHAGTRIEPPQPPASTPSPTPSSSTPSASAAPANPTLSPAPSGAAAVEPMDPFGGAPIPGKLPTVVGPILPEAMHNAPPSPKPVATPPKKNASQQASSADLQTVAHETSDAEAAKREMAAYVKKHGGSVRSVAGGLMVLVPKDKVSGVMAALSKHGSVNVQQSWSGQPSERQSKLVADLQEQRAALIRKRSELLVKYYEDAPAVKQVDEDLKTVERRIEELQIEPAAQHMAAVKVTFTTPR